MSGYDQRKSAAYHEAGHFVIGHAFGFPHALVSIRPDAESGTAGFTIGLDGGPWSAAWTTDATGHGLYDFTTQRARERVEQWVCSFYAGFAADVRFSPETEREARICASGDDDQAEEWLGRVGLATDADRSRLRECTAELVEKHWPEIERIALELLEREELDDVEAETLVEIVRGEATEGDLERYRVARQAAEASA